MKNLPLTTVALAGLLTIAVYSPAAHAQNFSVLYSFQGGTDGQYPLSALISDRAGNLYGMTNDGGVNCTFACGVVYELSPGETGYSETVIHRFSGPPNDGKGPLDDLVFGPDGSLYGTTTAGGSGLCHGGCGTVFRLTNLNGIWNEEVLYSFDPDNQGPNGGVVFDKQGNIYGTTSVGGVNSAGTVFELTPVPGGWTKNTIFTFSGSGVTYPVGNLVWDDAGNLYGDASGGADSGGIFELTPSANGWSGKVIHYFSSYSGGNYPTGGLTAHAGKLYGTTQNGGVYCLPTMYGCGVVYELSPTTNGWKETVLYTFAGGADGYFPADRPVFDEQGNLYATAYGGGTAPLSSGVVFRLEPTGNGWHETVLYSFTGGIDGGSPMTRLLLSKGRVFGTTQYGGASTDGTVFQLSPSN